LVSAGDPRLRYGAALGGIYGFGRLRGTEGYKMKKHGLSSPWKK
jgi:hypothetical protein